MVTRIVADEIIYVVVIVVIVVVVIIIRIGIRRSYSSCKSRSCQMNRRSYRSSYRCLGGMQ